MVSSPEGIFYFTLSKQDELPQLWILIVVVACMNFLYMHYVMSINTSRYRWVSREQAGTDYSTQSSFYFLGISAGMALCGFLADAVGYGTFFLISFAMASLIALFYATSLPKVERWVRDREAWEPI